MSTTAQRTSSPRHESVAAPAWPRWVMDLVRGGEQSEISAGHSARHLTIIQTPEHKLVRARVAGATRLHEAAFQEATTAAYLAIAGALSSHPLRHAVRFWNYIPSIHQPGSAEIDRYMVFNAGRFEACRQWMGDDFELRLPTASGVGHPGEDLIIDALACDVEGLAVENPRQVPAYRYTRRFGPRPPCFARATLLPAREGDPPELLVGGTASVLGEDSVHPKNLAAQMDQTLENLAALVRSAGMDGLESFRELRIYHVNESDAPTIRGAVAERFPASVYIEQMQAELCRKDLLVEIEGLAGG